MRSETRRGYRRVAQGAIRRVRNGDEVGSVPELAERASYSRFHFQRLFKAVMGESPGELRRRLLLERAADRLLRGGMSVTEVAFDAEYRSMEGFIRAFRKAYGVAPSKFRNGHGQPELPAPSGIHYRPILASSPTDFIAGEQQMDILDRLLQHDFWLTRQMLERAKRLSADQLDAPFAVPSEAITFEGKQQNLRQLFDVLVFGKEVWVAALENQQMPDQERSKTLEGMIARLEVAYPIFIGLAKKVRDQGRWDESFVDELCDPPETFTFGSMVAHVLTFGIHRRHVALEAMRRIGIEDLGYGDPIEWERSLEK